MKKQEKEGKIKNNYNNKDFYEIKQKNKREQNEINLKLKEIQLKIKVNFCKKKLIKVYIIIIIFSSKNFFLSLININF